MKIGAKLVIGFIVAVGLAILLYARGPEEMTQNWREAHPVQDIHERGGR